MKIIRKLIHIYILIHLAISLDFYTMLIRIVSVHLNTLVLQHLGSLKPSFTTTRHCPDILVPLKSTVAIEVHSGYLHKDLRGNPCSLKSMAKSPTDCKRGRILLTKSPPMYKTQVNDRVNSNFFLVLSSFSQLLNILVVLPLKI